MRLIHIIPLLILFSLFLLGCETKTNEVSSTSPNGEVHIIVSGTKTFMEPWDLTIEIKKGDRSNNLQTQLYADDISADNVIFQWRDNSTCIITLISQDDSQRSVEISI